MRLSRCCCCCCHLPLAATCISLAPLAAAFAFTRLACSYQCNLWLQTADLQLLLLLLLAVCCLLESIARATRQQRRQRCSDATWSACSYFRLPHFVAAARRATPKRASHLAYATHTPRQVTQILWHEHSSSCRGSMQSCVRCAVQGSPALFHPGAKVKAFVLGNPEFTAHTSSPPSAPFSTEEPSPKAYMMWADSATLWECTERKFRVGLSYVWSM